VNEARLRHLISVGRALMSELDPEVVLRQVVEAAREATGARYAALGILDEERVELERFITLGIDERTRARIGDLPRGRGVLGVLISDPKPLRLSRVGDHPKSYGFPTGHPPMGNFLGVPISIRGRAWGNLYLTEKTEGDFTEGDEEAVVILAGWAATALDNARLHQKVEARNEELERAMLTSRMTAEIARSVGGETELDRILELIVKRGRALVDAHSMLIFLVEGEELVIAATAGPVDASLRGRRFATNGTAMGEALRTGRVVWVEDLVAELAETASQPDAPVAPTQIAQVRAPKSLQIPMIFRGRPVGILSTVSADGDAAPGPDALDQLKTFAATAATAVATARSVAAQSLRRSLEAAEHERTRWAQELHDETLQDLASVNVLLSTTRRAPDAHRRGQAIDAAMAQVTESIRNLRSLISDLRPAALDELGVLPAMEALVERMGATSGLPVALDVNRGAGADQLEIRVEPAVELTIYRLTQEALTNVVKHADADQARVRIIEANGWIEVTVSDDGQGFDSTAHSEGFGLLGMRERVELAGGSFEVHSDPAGTTVCARLPAPHRVPG